MIVFSLFLYANLFGVIDFLGKCYISCRFEKFHKLFFLQYLFIQWPVKGLIMRQSGTWKYREKNTLCCIAKSKPIWRLWFLLSGQIELTENKWNFGFDSPYSRCQTYAKPPNIVKSQLVCISLFSYVSICWTHLLILLRNQILPFCVWNMWIQYKNKVIGFVK